MSLDVRESERAIREEFNTLAFARDSFPMLTDWGVEDFSVTIHSLGCSYLGAFGRHLGFWAMSEYPVRVDRNGGNRCVRPDTVWWSRPDVAVALIGEFERFDSAQPEKLTAKAGNLLQAHHQLGDHPRTLLLLTWALSGTNLQALDRARAVGHDGFRRADGVRVPGLGSNATLLVAAAIFSAAGEGRRMVGVRM